MLILASIGITSCTYDFKTSFDDLNIQRHLTIWLDGMYDNVIKGAKECAATNNLTIDENQISARMIEVDKDGVELATAPIQKFNEGFKDFVGYVQSSKVKDIIVEFTIQTYEDKAIVFLSEKQPITFSEEVYINIKDLSNFSTSIIDSPFIMPEAERELYLYLGDGGFSDVYDIATNYALSHNLLKPEDNEQCKIIEYDKSSTIIKESTKTGTSFDYHNWQINTQPKTVSVTIEFTVQNNQGKKIVMSKKYKLLDETIRYFTFNDLKDYTIMVE